MHVARVLAVVSACTCLSGVWALSTPPIGGPAARGGHDCGSGCPPAQCFAGRCLFGARDLLGDEDEDVLPAASRSRPAPDAQSRTPAAVAAPVALPDVQPTSVFADEDAAPVLKSRSATGVASASAPKDIQIEGAVSAEHAAPTHDDIIGNGAPIGRRTRKLFSEKAPLYRADVSILKHDIQLASEQLRAEQARGAALEKVNAELDRQIGGWRSTVARVAEREAKVARLMGRAKADSNITLVASSEAHIMRVEDRGNATLVQRLEQHMPLTMQVSNRALALLIASGVLFFALAAIFQFDATLEKTQAKIRHTDWGEVAYKVGTLNLGKSYRSDPILRRIGVGTYIVEISDLQIGNVIAGGECLRVSLQMGQNQEMSTQSLPCSESGYLNYADKFTLGVRRLDAPCLLSIIDKDKSTQERIAYVEIPANEILRIAQGKGNREYYRFNLVPEAHHASVYADAINGVPSIADGKPYVAMRIRDVSSRVAGKSPAGETPSCSPSERAGCLPDGVRGEQSPAPE